MGHVKLTSYDIILSILRFRFFYCKKQNKNRVGFFVSRTRKFEYINEYGSPSCLCNQFSEYGMATRTCLCTQISEKLAQYRWDIWYAIYTGRNQNSINNIARVSAGPLLCRLWPKLLVIQSNCGLANKAKIFATLPSMAIPVVEFLREEYKIRQVFGKKSTVVK